MEASVTKMQALLLQLLGCGPEIHRLAVPTAPAIWLGLWIADPGACRIR